MFSTLLLCALFCVCVLLVLRVLKKKAQVGKEPPNYPGSLPIIGITHLLLSDTSKLWDTFKLIGQTTMQNGGVNKTKIGFDTNYLFADPESAFTLANASLEKHYIYSFIESWNGQSLVTASASIWKRHRKLLNPAFSLPFIHGFVEIFNAQAKKLVDDMENFAGKGPFKASAYIKKSTFRTACLTTFGTEHSEELFEKYLNRTNQAMHLFIRRYQKAWQHSDLIYKLCGQKKIQDDLVNSLRQITDQMMTQKASNDRTKITDVQQLDAGASLRSVLQVNAHTSLSHKEVREELNGTILAAYETTSLQLETILILLGSHAEIQDRVFEEIIRVIGQGRDVNKEDIQKLVYTDAVIKESLRVAPSVPIIGRFIDRDVNLKNYTLRAGTQGFILVHSIHRHPSWGPDAEQFRPERWLEPGGVPDIASHFAGFGIGKRSCIGKTYAMTSLKISLTHLLRRYKVKADHTKLKYKLEATLKHVEGHDICLEKRKHL